MAGARAVVQSCDVQVLTVAVAAVVGMPQETLEDDSLPEMASVAR